MGTGSAHLRTADETPHGQLLDQALWSGGFKGDAKSETNISLAALR